MKTLKEYITESIVNEGFFQSLLGTGTSVDYFLSKIKTAARILNKEESNTVFGKLEPNKFAYDEKQKNIIYTGEVDSMTGIWKNKPIFKGVKIPKHLSDGEIKKLVELFGKTAIGKQAYKYSPEFKKELETKYKEQAEKDAKDPEKLAEQCAKLMKEMKRIGDSSDKKYKELGEQFEELERKGKKINKDKFERAYSKACDKLDVANTKPYKSSGSEKAHAGETYGGGTSSYDAGLR